jgi:hypothetical protein
MIVINGEIDNEMIMDRETKDSNKKRQEKRFIRFFSNSCFPGHDCHMLLGL